VFTGIIEEIGWMRKITRKGNTMILTIEANKVLSDVQLGDSIAVNGVCLTVVQYDKATVSMDVMPETYRLTNLSSLQIGSKVNLERAMAANGRFGGHIVQGHVDSTGVIVRRTAEENAVVFTIKPDLETITPFIIDRGSITIDGISLTVIHCDDAHFQVSIIPHTLAQTILNEKSIGSTVNLEADLMGKYIYHFLQRQGNSSTVGNKPKGTSGITANYLAENGFI
jgi:riboflavin synthase